MPDESNWQARPARLITPSGIKGSREQEERATSALLSSMQIVPGFGRAVIEYLGAPKGRIRCYVEPTFETEAGGTARPDGFIIVERGKTTWRCLVEVKTGDSKLAEEQVDRYLQIANQYGFDAVLTVSNEIVSDNDESPVRIDKRRLRRVRLGHLSWFRIMTEAVQEGEHYGVDDPEQAWILSDLISYLDDPRSGAAGFDGMGSDWVAVRNAARQRTLRVSDPGARTVAEDWEQFVEYMALHLRQRLGRPVTPIYARSSTRDSRLKAHQEVLGTHGRLTATIRVPDAVADIEIEADLASKQVTTSARLSAPKEGRSKTRVNWLLRQLRDVPNDLRVTVVFPRTRTTSSIMIDVAREKPDQLLFHDDPKREPNAFELALSRDMGDKKGKGSGSFVIETLNQVLDFYGDVLQDIRKWTPAPPKLPAEQPPAEPRSTTKTDLAVPNKWTAQIDQTWQKGEPRDGWHCA